MAPSSLDKLIESESQISAVLTNFDKLLHDGSQGSDSLERLGKDLERSKECSNALVEELSLE